ncbi:HNH endonuclease [Thiohalocapsa sp. ML1]|uniref:HNH endonuclease n=1 Tax=Thiohalocapsa sp. ML1 TaxID=1431688 RepID=UPI0009E7D02D|nr:HNH endonuclease signature motif containing protein [Thiohalocapsa sp. ML1]
MSGAFIPASLRRQVHQRAAGRCEYCGMPEPLSFAPHQIDHIIAEKHGGSTDPENLARSLGPPPSALGLCQRSRVS